jgi:hypothetical protein
MTPTPATNTRPTASKPESVTVVLPCCTEEEYARRTAKAEQVRDYIVPGYLAA